MPSLMESQTRRSNATMRALVFDGALRLGHLPRPRPAADELLLRVRASAISRQDIDMVQGRRPVQIRPVVLGHQFSAEVVEAGGEKGEEWVGKRVVVDPYRGCGRCWRCREGAGWLCASPANRIPGLGLVDGGFSEFVSVPINLLRELPSELDDEEALFLLPVAAGLRAVDQVIGPAPQRVLVVGDGNMGLLLTFMLHAEGHTVSVFGRHPSRREMLWRSGISFSGVPEGDASALAEMPDAVFTRESFGAVFECSGRPGGLEMAASAVRGGGRVIVLSSYHGHAGGDLRSLADREVEMMGIKGGPVDEAISYLAKRKVDILPLVDGRYPLEDAVGAFAKASQRGCLRVVLENSSPDGLL